jgi:AraC-like DNA-binding protein
MNHVSEPFLFDFQRKSTTAFREVFHAHLDMEFTYVHQGRGNLIIEGRTFAIEPGTLLIFQPFQLHRVQIKVTEDCPFIRSLVTFDPALLQPYLDVFPAVKSFFNLIKQQQGGKPVHRIKEIDPIISLLEHFNAVRSNLSSHELHEEYIFFLISYLRELRRIWREPEEACRAAASRYNHRAEEVMRWIERHYDETFRLERMAGELHLSPYHISHLFKEATGTTVLAYVQATRIRQACMLLMRNSLTIPEISVRVGIPNPSYFCKIFRESMGTTPHQYRLQTKRNS